jgi:hypothetical protein
MRKNIFKTRCHSCNGFAQKENPNYIAYNNKMLRGEIVGDMPQMYNICSACNGTGESLTTIGEITVTAKKATVSIIRSIADGIENL